MDVTQLVRQAAPTGQPPLARGYILKAPESYAELVKVVLPEGSTTRTYGPCKWSQEHGTTKPASGAACVVAFDEQGQVTVVWWDGIFAGGGGGEYTAGGGLELKEVVGKVFAIAPEGVLTSMVKKEAITKEKLAKALQEEIEAAITEAGEGLEKSGHKLLIKAKGVTDAMLAETYALLAGRKGGQIWYGGTEETDTATIRANSFAGSEGRIVVAHNELNFYEKAFFHSGLNVEAIEGLLLLEGLQKLTTETAVVSKGLELKTSEPAEIAANIKLKTESPISKLKFAAASGSFGAEATGQVILSLQSAVAIAPILVLTNVGTHTGVLRNKTTTGLKGEITNVGTEAEKKLIKGLASTAELTVQDGITGTGIKASATILSIPSNTEVIMSLAATKKETTNLTFTPKAGEGAGMFFANGLNHLLEPNKSIMFYFDGATGYRMLTEPTG